MNPGIEINRSDLVGDYKTARQFYAWTDKGRIYGTTYNVVKRKVERLGAGPYVQPPKQKKREVDPEHEYDFPFSRGGQA